MSEPRFTATMHAGGVIIKATIEGGDTNINRIALRYRLQNALAKEERKRKAVLVAGPISFSLEPLS